MARTGRVVGKAHVRTAREWLILAATVAGVTLFVGLVVWYFLSSGSQIRWQRQLRTDANYSVDMPGAAQIKVQQDQTEFGPTTVQTLQCQTSKPAATFTVQYSPFPANSPFLKMTKAQAEAALSQFVNRLAEQLDGKLVEQKDHPHLAGFGRSFRIQLAGKTQYHGLSLYLGPGQYQLSVIAPEEPEIPVYVPRFLNSFEYLGKSP